MLKKSLAEHLETMRTLAESGIAEIERSGQMICEALSSGKKILLCGNGGSAADAQHIAAELVGCYEKQRRSWPAIALTTDTSALTAVSNDLGYEEVFARQVVGLAQPGDVLIAISTSGKSKNVLRAAEVAHKINGSILPKSFKMSPKFQIPCSMKFYPISSFQIGLPILDLMLNLHFKRIQIQKLSNRNKI
jgi:D-sedoheptulose 7-phosphate isomerase